MKLKKIASLALAGVMAVSMLTACGNGTGDNGEGEGENNGNATGYSSVFAGVVSDGVKDLDYVTFQDNATDAAALKDALGNRGTVITLVNSLVGEATPMDDDGKTPNNVVEDFKDALKLTDAQYGYDQWNFDPAFMVNDTRKVGDIFVVDGTVDLTKALKKIADKYYNTKLEALDEKSSLTNNEQSYDFHYTVSVSVVNKTVDTIDWYHGSANFIAVTVTRTYTAD